jgi:hypothetical protein
MYTFVFFIIYYKKFYKKMYQNIVEVNTLNLKKK